jgi:hypothetical protein
MIRSTFFARRIAALGLAALGAATGSIFSPVWAQGRLDAHYSLSLGGVPFGKGEWLIDVREDQFSAAAKGGTTGLLRLFAKGQGVTNVYGIMSQGQPSATLYASNIQTDKKYDEVRMTMSNGNVREYVADPPTSQTPDRIPVTDAHRRGVTDPMTASLIHVPGNGDTFSPETCQRKMAIFDGRMRYDLRLAFKRLERVRSAKGYQGTVVACAVYFSPVAGYIPERPVIRYLVDLRDAEVWLAPVAGTRLMVPYRVSIPTPLGTGVLEASEFVSMPYPSAASNGIRSH